MTDEERQELAKARKKVDIANKFRIVFLIFALLILLFIFWGEKLFAGQGWYLYLCSKTYILAMWDLAAVFFTTFLKLFFVTRYNSIVRRIS